MKYYVHWLSTDIIYLGGYHFETHTQNHLYIRMDTHTLNFCAMLKKGKKRAFSFIPFSLFLLFLISIFLFYININKNVNQNVNL